MKKFIVIAALLLDCNMLIANSEHIKAGDEYSCREEIIAADNTDKTRQWLDDHESEARKIAISFIQKKGYSIQSVKLTDSNASNHSNVAFTTSGMLWAYYNYQVRTNDTNEEGSLIYITIKVKYDKPDWFVDYFRPYTN